MDVSLTFIHIGGEGHFGHWYIDLPHNNPNDIALCSKIERKLDELDKYNEGRVCIYLYEVGAIMPDSGIVQFADEDILRYLTTEDEFDLRMYIDEEEYTISSALYTTIETNLHLDLCKTLYNIYYEV